MPNILVKFFFTYWAVIMDLTKNFEVLNFPFFNILPGNFSSSKILSF